VLNNQDKLTPVKEGQVLNPKGYPVGQRNARTIVREFMDKPCDKLPEGSRVSRFQFLLWAVYESVFIFSKQVLFWKGRFEEQKIKLQEAKDELENNTDEKKDVRLKAAVNARTKDLERVGRDLERVTRLFQEASGKAAEHFQKASGQYSEIKELINNTPTIVTADSEDITKALEVIENEL